MKILTSYLLIFLEVLYYIQIIEGWSLLRFENLNNWIDNVDKGECV